MSVLTEQHLSSTFGSYQVTVTKATTVIATQDSPYASILKPLDSNKNSATSNRQHLSNQLYIEAFCQKENTDRAEQTRKETIYEKERRIIDLQEENFKLRSQLFGVKQPQPTVDTSILDKEHKLTVESLTKQFELKLEKQDELHKLEVWRLKEDIEALHYQLRSANEALELMEAEAADRAYCKSEEREERHQYNNHCVICSDGEIIDRMCKMHNALEDDHNLCLQYRKESTLKIINLEQELQDVQRELDQERKQQVARAARIAEAEKQCRQLLCQKNELDSKNISLIEENARLKLREDQLKIREEHLRLRETETNRSLARSETTENILHLQPPPTTKSALPMKGSIIDRLHGGLTADLRRPNSSVNKINTTVSFDLPDRTSTASHSGFERKLNGKLVGSIDRVKERPHLTNTSLTPSNPALAAILSTTGHTLDTFRPHQQRKHQSNYKYNV